MRSGVIGALLLLAAVLPAGCAAGSTIPVPGIAHPAASADDGFPIPDDALLHDFNGIDLVLPPGWHAQIADDCVSPPDAAARAPKECPAQSLRIRPDASLDGHIDRAGEALDDPEGYRRPWAVCAAPPGAAERPAAEASHVSDHGAFTLVSGERVQWSEWSVECSDGPGFRTRVWYVPAADLEFDVPRVAAGMSDGYDYVVRSVDLSRYG